MNVKRQHKTNGATRTQKNGGNKKSNPSTKIGTNRTYKQLQNNGMTRQIGGWGKKKSPEDLLAEKDAKKAANNAAKLATEEKQKLAADAKAKKTEAEKAKKAEEQQKKEAEKTKKAEEQQKKEEAKNESETAGIESTKNETKEESKNESETEETEYTKNETKEESKNESETEVKKPWYKRARNGLANSTIGKTLKKGSNAVGAWATKKATNIKESVSEFVEGAKERPLATIGNVLKSPFTYGSKKYDKLKYSTKKNWTGFKKLAANAADTISPMRQIQKYRTNKRLSAKAKSDIKFNKYIDKVADRKEKINNLSTERANLLAKGELSEDEKKELAKLEKQINSEKDKLGFNEYKAAKWKGKQTTAENAMTKYADELAYKSAPVKKELDQKVAEQTKTFLNSPVAKENAQKEIDAELETEFKNTRQTELANLEKDTDYMTAKQLADSDKCKNPSGNNIAQCKTAHKTLSDKTREINDNLEAKKKTARTQKETEINKRILKAHGMNIINQDLAKLTKTMRLPSEISTPGTPQHTELQEKIQAHIEEHGKMPPADEISKMVAGTAYEQTLTNTAKDMSLEVKNSLTSRKEAYKDSAAAIADISHPMAKTGVIEQSIKDFIPKIEAEIIKLKNEKLQKRMDGETEPEFTARQNAQKSKLTMKQTLLRGVKQMLTAGKPVEQIYNFIGRYESGLKDSVVAKTNNLNIKADRLKEGTDENKAAVQKYYDAEMASLGYPEMTPLLLAFARQYYIGPPPLNKNQKMTIANVAKSLRYYKDTILPHRIANNPLIMDNLPKPRKTTIQSAVKSLNINSSSISVATNPLLTNTKPNTNSNPNTSEQPGKNNPSTATTQIPKSTISGANNKSKNKNTHRAALEQRINTIYNDIIIAHDLEVKPENEKLIKKNVLADMNKIAGTKGGYNTITDILLTNNIKISLNQHNYEIFGESTA